MAVHRMVTVDPKLCRRTCVVAWIQPAPEVFDVGDDDVASMLAATEPSLWPAVRAAIDACPRGASASAKTTRRTQP